MTESKKKAWRLLNPDGSFNIEQRDCQKRDFYVRLMAWSWRKFIGVLALIYVLLNLGFAVVYLALGPDAVVFSDFSPLTGSLPFRFEECFFFSVQTFATIGYGKFIPNGFAANALMTVESFLGVLYVALVTGVFFARFSKPTARVIFSKRALIREEDGVPSLIFRLANLRANQIVDAQITVSFARREKTKEGETYRTFQELNLERRRSPMFVLSWTVIHPIDSNSPLYKLTQEDLFEQEAEVVVVLTGWDETFASTIHARYSYGPEDIFWNHRFVDILVRTPDQKLAIETSKIHDVEPVGAL